MDSKIIAAIIIAVGFVTGAYVNTNNSCKNQLVKIEKQDKDSNIARFSLISSHITNGMVRLDSLTGEMKWCYPDRKDINDKPKVLCIDVNP
jgi:hypothetical protein